MASVEQCSEKTMRENNVFCHRGRARVTRRGLRKGSLPLEPAFTPRVSTSHPPQDSQNFTKTKELIFLIPKALLLHLVIIRIHKSVYSKTASFPSPSYVDLAPLP